MRPPGALQLLAVWERGSRLSVNERALELLTLLQPEAPREALAQMTIGERDAQLLAFREYAFGPDVQAVAHCPHCNQQLDVTFGVQEICVKPDLLPVDGVHGKATSEYQFEVDGYAVRFRLPNSLDLAAVANRVSLEDAQHDLFQRCVLSVERNTVSISLGSLPRHLVDAVTTKMSAADPQADVQLSLVCPTCESRWDAPFDIVSFLWSELGTWARRILREVHTLAVAYGWTEAEILNLSPQRRQTYLQMVGA